MSSIDAGVAGFYRLLFHNMLRPEHKEMNADVRIIRTFTPLSHRGPRAQDSGHKRKDESSIEPTLCEACTQPFQPEPRDENRRIYTFRSHEPRTSTSHPRERVLSFFSGPCLGRYKVQIAGAAELRGARRDNKQSQKSIDAMATESRRSLLHSAHAASRQERACEQHRNAIQNSCRPLLRRAPSKQERRRTPPGPTHLAHTTSG